MNAATYSVEDNKLRLYVGRVSREDYDALRAAGFQATPKQDCDFVAVWTPAREDMAREFLADGEDIGDEDYSATERAADRADRFQGYQDKRTEEAVSSADAYESGPQAFGHQSRARAERQARRHDRKRLYAVSQWSKAEYWADRTAGVIASALHKADPRTRRGRIKVLEAEQRRHEKERAEYAERYAAWSKVATLDGADRPGRYVTERGENGVRMGFVPETVTDALRLAFGLANTSGGGWKYRHPRTGAESSLYSHLTNEADPITPAEAAALWLENRAAPGTPGTDATRWSEHYKLRLTYERAMLANEGGTAADADMEPGGFIGAHQVHAVNRSSATKKVVSVRLDIGGKVVLRNVERLPEGAYRAPTDEERAAFRTATEKAKAERRAASPKAPSLINPTNTDAERFQAEWNRAAKAKRPDAAESAVWYMTQAEYSARSKGGNGPCDTSEVSENLRVRAGGVFFGTPHDRATVFKVRTGSASGYTTAPRRVVVLTDKPQKALPWAEVEAVKADMPTAESLFPRLGDIREALSDRAAWDASEEQKQLLADAIYIGWAYSASVSQHGFTDEGAKEFRRWHAEHGAELVTA